MKAQPWNVLRFTGTGSWNSITHKSATLVIDNGVAPYWPHSVVLTTAAAHALTAGSAITLWGSVNYDGTYKILAVPTTVTLVVEHTFIVETLTTTDTFKLTLAPKQEFEWGGFKLHLNAAVTTAANLTVNVDAGAAADVYDHNLYTKAMSGVQDVIYIPENPIPFAKDDEIDFAWANADGVTYGLEVLWRRI